MTAFVAVVAERLIFAAQLCGLKGLAVSQYMWDVAHWHSSLACCSTHSQNMHVAQCSCVIAVNLSYVCCVAGRISWRQWSVSSRRMEMETDRHVCRLGICLWLRENLGDAVHGVGNQ